MMKGRKSISEIREISGRTELGLPVPRLGPEQSRNTVLLSRLDKDESPSRLQFHETKKSHHQGSAVLGNRTGAGGWVFPGGFPAWDASECALNRCGDTSAMSLRVGVCPRPVLARSWGSISLFLLPASKTAPHITNAYCLAVSHPSVCFLPPHCLQCHSDIPLHPPHLTTRC